MRSITALASLAFLGSMVSLAGTAARSHRHVSSLLVRKIECGPQPYHTQAERDAWISRRRSLAGLWAQRNRRDIGAALLPYLADPDLFLRESTAKALGRLEYAPAYAPLARIAGRMKTEEDQSRAGGIPLVTLRLAMSRIRTRQSDSQTRLGDLPRSLGVSWQDLVDTSRQINASQPRKWSGSSGDQLLREVVDTMCVIERQRHRLPAMTGSLVLSNGEKAKLRAATMTSEGEAATLLDYLSHRKVVQSEDEELTGYLAHRGPVAANLVFAELQKITQNPGSYRGGRGYCPVFDAAALIGDQRAVPLLSALEHDQDTWLAQYASTARQRLVTKQAIPSIP